MNRETLKVTGMTCGHCVMSVDKAVRKVPGVTDVKVVLSTGTVDVDGTSLDRGALVKAIEKAGYEVSAQP